VLGVLHRDIKPSNILLTAYGHPVLSDFGIAATLSESDDREAVGMSIPWSAPEVLMDETAGTVASEVWAFAATVYSLLAGRSPFEVPGDSNKSTDLISRINRAKPQPMDRNDVPQSLERALWRAMSRKPESRQSSILELVRELQAVETELGVPQTPVEVVMDDWALATVADLEDRTRIRGGVVPRGTVSQRRRRRRSGETTGDYSAVGTLIKEEAPLPRSSGTRPQDRGGRFQMIAWILVAAAVLAVVLGTVATLVLLRSASSDIPMVTAIDTQVTDNTVEFTWSDPGLGATDTYQVSTSDGSAPVQQRGTSFVVDAEPGDRVCITVAVNREGKTGTPSSEKCADVPQ
jgi:hypothetical protein